MSDERAGPDKLVPIATIALSILGITATVLIWKEKLETAEFALLVKCLILLAVLCVFLALWQIYNMPPGRWCRRQAVNLWRRLKTFWLVYWQVHRPWNKYIHGPTRDELIGRVRYAIARKYFDQEATEINGEGTAHEARYCTNGECPSVIVTDFVNYAELVKTIVHTSLTGVRQRKKGEAILCFTSLRLSLHDWFNFDRGLYSDSEWSDDYLKEIERWSKNSRDLIVARHLLCASDEDLAQACGIKGRTKDALSHELQSWIWRPRGEDGKTHLEPILRYQEQGHYRTLLVQEIKEKAEKLSEEDEEQRTRRDKLLRISQSIKERYNEHNMAFVIVENSDGLLDDLDPLIFDCGEFQLLGDAFSSGYQTKLQNCEKRLLTYGVALSDEKACPGSFYAPSDPKQRPIATDFFLVCTVEEADLEKVTAPYSLFETLDPKPLICLEGQDRAKAVHLALLDAGKNERYLEDLLGYCRLLLSQNAQNEDLFSNE